MIFCLWSKFQQSLIKLGEVIATKLPKMDHFMDAGSPRNNLKFYNLVTTNAIKMKLAKIMYHLA